jgi:hypothetical protein
VESSDGEHGVSGVPVSCSQQPATSSSTIPASSSTVQAPAVFALDLRSIQLQCGAAGITVREKLSEYERSQMDPHRIRKLLSEKCGCREGCFSKLKPKESQLVQVGRVCPPSNFRYPLPCPTVTLAFLAPSSHSCLAGDLEVLHWWYGHLGDDERIFMFSTLYDYIGRSPSSESGKKQLRTSWSLCGVTICRLGFRKVIGIGSTKLVKMIHGIPDRRRHYVHQRPSVPKRSADHRRPRFPEYSGFHSPGPTTLELGPPQFWPVVHISHRLVSE